MVNPRYDISQIPKEILYFLEIARCGTKSDDPILLALVQKFWRISWRDILMPQDMIGSLFVRNKAPDGRERPIIKGQVVNLMMAVHYARYRFNQPIGLDLTKWLSNVAVDSDVGEAFGAVGLVVVGLVDDAAAAPNGSDWRRMDISQS